MFKSPKSRDIAISSPVENASSDMELKRIRRAMEISIDEEVTAEDVD